MCCPELVRDTRHGLSGVVPPKLRDRLVLTTHDGLQAGVAQYAVAASAVMLPHVQHHWYVMNALAVVKLNMLALRSSPQLGMWQHVVISLGVVLEM